jgi:nitroreductase
MDLSEAVLTRRTIKDFKPDPVPADLLERVLAAGLWAQNHRLTQPWRFAILGPQTHRKLAVGADKLLSKPQIVAVSYRLSEYEAQRREDCAAVACAIQIIQLAAWAEGLGMQWSSGKIIRLTSTYELLEIVPEEEEIVGLLFFGFPADVPAAQHRKPLGEVSRRLP